MRIDFVYDNVTNELRKIRNGFYPISQFNLDAEREQINAFNDYFKGYSATQELHDALSPFKLTYPFFASDSAKGLVSLPSDYGHLLSASKLMYSNSQSRPIRQAIVFVNEDERDSRIESQLRPVTVNSPIAVQNNASFQLYPQIATVGEAVYLRLPKKPLYLFTQTGRQPVYNPTGSQDIEFSDLYMPDIIERIVNRARVFLDQQSQSQTA